MATIKFGSARINENGTTTGGKYGDQTGSEVSTQNFYMHTKGWLGFRFYKKAYADAMATAMKEACDNDNIGYCQDHRGTLLTEFKKTMSIKKITTPCEADCSSLVRVCIYQACGVLLDNFTTSTEPAVLRQSGLFEEFTVASSASVYNGDVLVTKTSGHTGAIVSGRPRSSDDTSTDEDLKIDGEIGNLSVRKWQTVMGQTGSNVDGFIDGQDSKQKKYWKSIISEACKWTGGSSALVKKWQTYLKNKGYSIGSCGVDGELGEDTAKASQKFLIAQGYSCGSAGVDGEFYTESAKALQKWLNAQ